MGRLTTRGWLIGGLLVLALVIASASALVFQGRDEGDVSSRAGEHAVTTGLAASTTSTSTSTTTTSTTTTLAPPPPTAAPPTTAAPAPQAPAAAPLPAPEPPPAPAPAPASSYCDGPGSAVINAMNADRLANGLGALCGNGALAGYAQAWANWMAQQQSLTHQDLNAVLAGTTFGTLGENILSGSGGMSVADMEGAWMASPGHRQNILNGAYSAAGVGIAYSSDGRVWVAVDFGG
jgi:uncharacterized protein YkwD